jgi:hypothetical protein
MNYDQANENFIIKFGEGIKSKEKWEKDLEEHRKYIKQTLTR